MSMHQSILIRKVFSNVDIFQIVSYVHPDGIIHISSAMLFRGLTGNYLE